MTTKQRQARKLGTEHLPNRSRGKRSPLDRLPPKVRGELARRLHAGDTYATARAWLAADCGLEIGISALCDWFRKRMVEGPKAPTEAFHAGGFSFRVEAPGASSITVHVNPSAGPAGRDA